jgi:hypothetical protein
MTAGRRRAVARGDFIGWRPDGYKLEVELDGARVRKRMVIDPARREAIELIFEMALKGRPSPRRALKMPVAFIVQMSRSGGGLANLGTGPRRSTRASLGGRGSSHRDGGFLPST